MGRSSDVQMSFQWRIYVIPQYNMINYDNNAAVMKYGYYIYRDIEVHRMEIE